MTQATPFIIWTLRRTGGTNLGGALFTRANLGQGMHEPFNTDRPLGKITQAWKDLQDENQLARSLDEVFQQPVLIKHCVEIIPGPINLALAEKAVAKGYRHVFLYRANSLDRLMSLHFASQSGIWGKRMANQIDVDEALFRQPIPVDKLITHEQHCRTELNHVYRRLCALGQKPVVLKFEALYQAEAAQARQDLVSAFAALGMPIDEEKERGYIDNILKAGDQGTRERYRLFADYPRLAQALATLGDFTLGATAGFDVRNAAKLPKELLACSIWTPHRDQKSGLLELDGVVLPGVAAGHGLSLRLAHRGGEIPVAWDLPSPKFAEKYPDQPQARKARFQVSGIPCADGEQVGLMLVSKDGQRTELAKISAIAAAG